LKKIAGQLKSRFKANVKRGHALLATVLSQQPVERLHKSATLELTHHVIQSQSFNDPITDSGKHRNEIC